MDPDEETLQMQLLLDRNLSQYKLLLKALRARDLRAFKKLVRQKVKTTPEGINVNYVFPYPYNKTSLDIACSDGLPEFVEFLLQAGADPNIQNEDHKRAPIHFATEAKDGQVLKILLSDSNINPNVEAGVGTGTTALHIAVKNDDLECAKLLLEADASPNIANARGVTALHLAASQKNRDMVDLVFEISKFVDLDRYRDPRKFSARDLLRRNFPEMTLPPINERQVDSCLLRYYLNSNDEKNFLLELNEVEYETLKNTRELLMAAARNNLKKAFDELMKRENGIDTEGLLQIAEEALSKGHLEILRDVLEFDKSLCDKLLIPACRELGVPGCKPGPNNEDNRLCCLKLILEQDHVNVRCEDGEIFCLLFLRE